MHSWCRVAQPNSFPVVQFLPDSQKWLVSRGCYRKNADCDTPLAVLQFLDSYDLCDFLTAQGVRSEVARHRYAHADEIMAD